MSFQKEVSLAVKGMKAKAGQFVTAVNLELFTSIIKDTPVDTGRARGNWQTTQNTPALGEIARLGQEPSIAEAQARLRGLGLFWLSNNLPYIEKLEFDGHSSQAPEGMLRKNVARISSIARKHQ